MEKKDRGSKSWTFEIFHPLKSLKLLERDSQANYSSCYDYVDQFLKELRLV